MELLFSTLVLLIKIWPISPFPIYYKQSFDLETQDCAVPTIFSAAAAAAKSLQSCPTLCDPIDGSPLGSSVPGILQARILEWVAVSFSNARKWKVKVKSLSRVRLLVTPWTVAYQAPLSMGFFMQEYWSGVPLPSLSQSCLLPVIPLAAPWPPGKLLGKPLGLLPCVPLPGITASKVCRWAENECIC